MFTSLDRVDIVLKAGPDGRQRYVQTDHRTVAEVEQQRELSALFALIRLLNPKRMVEAGEPEPEVIYFAKEPPPASLRRIIAAAGGRLMIETGVQPVVESEEPLALEEIIDSVFEDLARSVAEEHGVSLTPLGLQSVENALAVLAGDPEKDEAAYWSSVLKLGSFGGEVIRASNGGHWGISNSGTLPISLKTRFRGEEATVNPLGKAIKRFANGEEDSLVTLVEMLLEKS